MGRPLNIGELEKVSGGWNDDEHVWEGQQIKTDEFDMAEYMMGLRAEMQAMFDENLQDILDNAIDTTLPEIEIDDGLEEPCTNEVGTADDKKATIFGGDSEHNDIIANVLNAITEYGSDISGTFEIRGEMMTLNLGSIFSLGDRALSIGFADHADGALGRTAALGSATWVTFDIPAIQSASGSFVGEFVDTIIHELMHVHGHVVGNDALTQQDYTGDGFHEAAQALAEQLMNVLEQNGENVTDANEGCDS